MLGAIWERVSKPCLDAQPVKQRPRRRLCRGLWADTFAMASSTSSITTLRTLALVGTGLVFHDGHAVFLVARIPGLDGAPGELAGMAVLVGEGHLADGLDAGLDGVALGHVNGAEHPHFQISSGISHESCFSCPPAFGRRRRFFIHAGDATGGWQGTAGWDCRVVAGQQNPHRHKSGRGNSAKSQRLHGGRLHPRNGR